MKKIHFSLGSIDTVVGTCENCEEDTVLVAVVTDYYRCTNCGADTKHDLVVTQKILIKNFQEKSIEVKADKELADLLVFSQAKCKADNQISNKFHAH
jgi:hypothetical protein